MQRRQFLQGLGSAGAATLLAACARSFQMPRSTMTGQGTGNGLDKRDPDGRWREAAAYARWTPSPHNIQPWRLRVLSAHEAEVYHDPRRRLPDTDPTSAFTTMSLAMFVEALSIAVAPHQARIEARYEARTLDYATSKPSLFATLRLIDEPNVPQRRARATGAAAATPNIATAVRWNARFHGVSDGAGRRRMPRGSSPSMVRQPVVHPGLPRTQSTRAL